MRDIDAITGGVIDLALRIHRDLGPGLLESVYETVLAGKLVQMGYVVDRQLKRVVNNLVPSAPPRLRVNKSKGLPNV